MISGHVPLREEVRHPGGPRTPTRGLELEEGGPRPREGPETPPHQDTALLGGEKAEQLLNMQRRLLPRTCTLRNS